MGIETTGDKDFRKYYNLEDYIFNEVRQRFHEQEYLSAFDFFCIVIWKANRAKSYVAKRLLLGGQDRQKYDNLDEAVQALTNGLRKRPDQKAKLEYLWSNDTWGFALPMATAILTVLYPEEFTIYDVRVCEALKADGGKDFCWLAQIHSDFEKLWGGYKDFRSSVVQATPEELSLRDKDRNLWGKSFYKQLKEDIARGFALTENEFAPSR